MNNKLFWLCAVKNVLALICFTVLAIVFQRWWIVLFALLFMSGVETKRNFYRVCDGCGKHSPYGKDINDGLKKAKEAGWTHIVKGDKDYCPECASTMEELFHGE